jgi:hypothetical protein
VFLYAADGNVHTRYIMKEKSTWVWKLKKYANILDTTNQIVLSIINSRPMRIQIISKAASEAYKVMEIDNIMVIPTCMCYVRQTAGYTILTTKKVFPITQFK